PRSSRSRSPPRACSRRCARACPTPPPRPGLDRSARHDRAHPRSLGDRAGDRYTRRGRDRPVAIPLTASTARATVSRLSVVLVCLLGIPVGIGAFTFVYAKGFSYLSTDPRACVNCHIMNAQYDAWLKSGHRHTATCVQCHLPDHGLAKWVAKADHGFRHSMAFTLQNF